MPRKTREQKIIAELRRKLQTKEPSVAKPVVQENQPKETGLPRIIAAPIASASVDYSYLKRDLLKVAALVALLTALEIAINLIISSGGFKSFGLN